MFYLSPDFERVYVSTLQHKITETGPVETRLEWHNSMSNLTMCCVHTTHTHTHTMPNPCQAQTKDRNLIKINSIAKIKCQSQIYQLFRTDRFQTHKAVKQITAFPMGPTAFDCFCPVDIDK